MAKARSIINTRAGAFAAKARSCNGIDLSRLVAQSGTLSRQIGELMISCYDGKVYTSCATGECRIVSLKTRKSRMQALANRLGSLAKRIKIQAGQSCPAETPAHGVVDTRKRSDDYTADLVSSIKAMPDRVYRCN